MIMKKIPKSLRKFIRVEKAKIRRENHTIHEIQEKIKNLYQKIGYEYKRDI